MARGNIIDNIGQIFRKKPTRVGIIDVGDEKIKIETIGTNLSKVNTAGFVEIINSEMPVIIDCYTEWCGPCKMIDPIFAKLAAEYDGIVKFIKVDLDKAPTIARHFKIMGVPTLMLIKDGIKIKSMVGYSGEGKLKRAVDKMLKMEIDQFEL
ncbi:MAG: thioredoxin [Methanosarcinaceae archaeon]|nr:thioredoxin [Methanosarcinaceae archaeon]